MHVIISKYTFTGGSVKCSNVLKCHLPNKYFSTQKKLKSMLTFPDGRCVYIKVRNFCFHPTYKKYLSKQFLNMKALCWTCKGSIKQLTKRKKESKNNYKLGTCNLDYK